MWVGIISLFPQMFSAITEYGVLGRAIQQDIIRLTCWNPRDFTGDRHHTVDDRPYGGGPGMLMKVEPLRAAIRAAKASTRKSPAGKNVSTIYVSPQGRKLDQKGVLELASRENIIFVAGRYEGIDERLIQTEIDEEWSLGDFVLSGGELAIMAMIDAVARFIPGVLGHDQSAEQDSFVGGLLDCPHFTRPEVFGGEQVTSVLLSGNHEEIRKWRLKQSLGRTWQRRPDLLSQLELDAEQESLLSEFVKEST